MLPCIWSNARYEIQVAHLNREGATKGRQHLLKYRNDRHHQAHHECPQSPLPLFAKCLCVQVCVCVCMYVYIAGRCVEQTASIDEGSRWGEVGWFPETLTDMMQTDRGKSAIPCHSRQLCEGCVEKTHKRDGQEAGGRQ